NRCPYCWGPLNPTTFCPTAKVPISRNGRFDLPNLDICCPGCQKAKGVLDASEFKEVLALLRTWPRLVSRDFLARLRAGAARVPADLPRIGSLEWFLGPDHPAFSASGAGPFP